MSPYVDVDVLPVAKAKLDAYRHMAEDAGRVWREHGACQYLEIIADDVQPGVHTSFPQAVKLEPDEIVVVGWISYDSREHRDRVNAAVMTDPRMAGFDPANAPFDGKRMFWGGFAPLVEA